MQATETANVLATDMKGEAWGFTTKLGQNCHLLLLALQAACAGIDNL